MAVVNLGGSGTIYDPNLPARVAQQPQQQPQNPSLMPNTNAVDAPSAQEDNFPVPMDPGIASMLARAATPQNAQQPQATPLTYAPSFPATGNYSPSPLGPAQSVKGNYLNRYLGNVDARGAPYPMRPATAQAVPLDQTPQPPVRPADLGTPVQTAQAPASATPQGWNLFTALGQALSHLLGYNASGQPQGMSGLVRNPVQAAPTQTAALRMPTPQASRYQGRTLIG